MDARYVVASIQEHDEWHLNLERTVVVIKIVLDLRLHATKVINLTVYTRLNVNAVHKISEDDALRVEDLVLADIELGIGLIKK